MVNVTGTPLLMASAVSGQWKDVANKFVEWNCINRSDNSKVSVRVRRDQYSRIHGKPYMCLDSTYYAKATNIKENIESGKDFTVAIWLYVKGSSTVTDICASGPGSLVILYDQGVGDGYSYCSNGAGWTYLSHTPPPNNVWHHCAMTCKNSKMMFFLDGHKLDDRPAFISPITDLTFLTDANGRRGYNGAGPEEKFYDEIVIIKNQCVWTDDFDPNTVKFDFKTVVDKKKLRLY